MAAEEQKAWEAAAAAYDGGKGIALEEYDPDDNNDMVLASQALQVTDPHAKRRLKRFIRNLQQQRQQQQGKSRFASLPQLNCVDVTYFVCSPVTLTCLF